jgi:DNA-binding transcriptional MerR regulator
MNTLLSLRDCARRLGITPHRIAYAHELGKLADVECRVAGKRIYTEADVKRVADYFGIELKEQEKPRRPHE